MKIPNLTFEQLDFAMRHGLISHRQHSDWYMRLLDMQTENLKIKEMSDAEKFENEVNEVLAALKEIK